MDDEQNQNNENVLLSLLENINDIYFTLDLWFRIKHFSPSIKKISTLALKEIEQNRLDAVLTHCNVLKLKRGIKQMQIGAKSYYMQDFSVAEGTGINKLYRLKLKRPLDVFGFESAVIGIVQKIE